MKAARVAGALGAELREVDLSVPLDGRQVREIRQALLEHLGALAVERGCGRFEWSVLDWNTPSPGVPFTLSRKTRFALAMVCIRV